MEGESNISEVEKQRLRDTIAEQVRCFLEKGGHITVIDSPAPTGSRYRGYAQATTTLD